MLKGIIMKKYTENKRNRQWFGTRNYYYETHNENGEQVVELTEKKWKNKILKEFKDLMKVNEHIKEYWLIFHDKDKNDNDELGQLHVHFYIEYDNGVWPTSIMKQLQVSKESNLTAVKNVASVFKYMLHISDKAMEDGKAIYHVSDLICVVKDKGKLGPEDVEKYYKVKAVDKKSKRKANERYEEELFVESKLAQLGTDLLYNKDELWDEVESEFGKGKASSIMNRYDSVISTAERRKIRKLEREYAKQDRKTINVLVTGRGGSGKSTVVKDICKIIQKVNNYMDPFKVSSGGQMTDYLDSYNMEEIAIFDDFASSKISFDGFNNMFDRKNGNRIQSRYVNKFFYSRYNFITTSDSFEKVCSKVARKFKNDTDFDNLKYQVGRRFKWILKYNYDKDTDKYYISITEIKENEADKTPVFSKDYIFEREAIYRGLGEKQESKYQELVEELANIIMDK